MQTVRWLWWMVFGVETGRKVGRIGQIRIGFVEEQYFKFGVKELWRDSQGRSQPNSSGVVPVAVLGM